jgi:hypothetical protein
MRFLTCSSAKQLHLLLEAHLRRVRRGVGKRAGLADRAHEGRDTTVVAALLEDLLRDGAVLAFELAHLDRRRLLVGPLLHLDAQPSLPIGLRSPRDAPMEAAQVDRACTARQADVLRHLGDGADLRILAVVARDEQHTFLLADLGVQRHVHVGEDDDVVERNEQQGAQETPTHLSGTMPTILASTTEARELFPGRVPSREIGDRPGAAACTGSGARSRGRPLRLSRGEKLLADDDSGESRGGRNPEGQALHRRYPKWAKLMTWLQCRARSLAEHRRPRGGDHGRKRPSP